MSANREYFAGEVIGLRKAVDATRAQQDDRALQ